ncbi:hypothetical protein K443DRAFT_559230 [Laccaria amethystina LaAM-08-1]|uniref:Uncharacterized protein n=1 Tax=Laccaria amethystina LaAM-08-1 TaxID=1095629 RepID=A0A0C9X898_9AGAR|nr:hypothetical protein K443DRAFT_559230 [Laccaria amethystina LaAM-08-1]
MYPSHDTLSLYIPRNFTFVHSPHGPTRRSSNGPPLSFASGTSLPGVGHATRISPLNRRRNCVVHERWSANSIWPTCIVRTQIYASYR